VEEQQIEKVKQLAKICRDYKESDMCPEAEETLIRLINNTSSFTGFTGFREIYFDPELSENAKNAAKERLTDSISNGNEDAIHEGTEIIEEDLSIDFRVKLEVAFLDLLKNSKSIFRLHVAPLTVFCEKVKNRELKELAEKQLYSKLIHYDAETTLRGWAKEGSITNDFAKKTIRNVKILNTIEKYVKSLTDSVLSGEPDMNALNRIIKAIYDDVEEDFTSLKDASEKLNQALEEEPFINLAFDTEYVYKDFLLTTPQIINLFVAKQSFEEVAARQQQTFTGYQPMDTAP
ncbi:MAG: hypothetical protein AAF621_05695, partial [Pseudomonadota bacterium]